MFILSHLRVRYLDSFAYGQLGDVSFAVGVYHTVSGLHRSGISDGNGMLIISSKRAGTGKRLRTAARPDAYVVDRDVQRIACRGDRGSARALLTGEPPPTPCRSITEPHFLC